MNKNDDLNTLEASLIKTIGNDNFKEIVIDYSEVTIDSFIKNDLLKEIPFFGTLYKSYKGFISIKDALFANKVLYFLEHVKDISAEEKKKFIDNLESNHEEKIKVGKTLLLIIDKLDDLDKPRIIGNLFRANLKNQITYNDFLRLSTIVQNVFYSDLIKLNISNNYSQPTQDHFTSVGILTSKLKNNSTNLERINGMKTTNFEIKYELTYAAKLLIKYGLEKI